MNVTECKLPAEKDMETTLSTLQQQIVRAQIPVIILFEGFSAAGKGAAISSLILNFDPRGFSVCVTRAPEETESRKPWIQRFMAAIPAHGRIAVFDKSWYSGMLQIRNNIKKPTLWNSYLDDINTFERQLADDGYLIIKFFLRISRKEQAKRLKKLAAHKDTAWRVNKRDMKNLKRYKQIASFYSQMVAITDRPYARWHVLDAERKCDVRDHVFETVIYELEQALKAKEAKDAQPTNPTSPAPDAVFGADALPRTPYINVKFRLREPQRIENLDLSKDLEREEYKKRLKEGQKELKQLHNVLYKRKIPVVIGFEGNDAAGKGGSIRRVARALDPRGYTVDPISAPTPDERSRHYLWRFYTHLPKTGHITIFDRTWYGRVLVERVEKLTPTERILEAYNEINEFEYQLHKWGAIVVKFWLAVDKDEQLKRFEERRNTPEKQWKITDEDWRNREKWDIYTQAVNDMLSYTNTDFAPWTVVESNSKLYARIKVLDTILAAINEHI